MRCPVCGRRYPTGTQQCLKDGASVWGSVSEALVHGPVPLSLAVKIAIQVLEHLASVHGSGQILGHISPDAVFFHADGPRITAQVADAHHEWTPALPGYTAPEQVAGQPDVGSDLFAMGVLLHHMITGRPPVPGQPLPSLLDETLQDVPDALDQLIAQLTRPDPKARLLDAGAVRSQLENLELDSTVMGDRLAEVRQAYASRLGSAPPPSTDGEEAPTRASSGERFLSFDSAVDSDTLGETVIESQGGGLETTDDADVDPFADTFVRNRSVVEEARALVAEEARALAGQAGFVPDGEKRDPADERTRVESSPDSSSLSVMPSFSYDGTDDSKTRALNTYDSADTRIDLGVDASLPEETPGFVANPSDPTHHTASPAARPPSQMVGVGVGVVVLIGLTVLIVLFW